jgi:hypothetical protein
MNKDLYKFHTPKDIAKKCIDLAFDTFKDISETVEPSAGTGNFSLQIENCIAYDIEPGHKSIIEQDFLTLDLPYKKGRLIIGNPPFGDRNNLARSFYKKCIHICDYIAFILPIGLLNNKDSLYEFDLVKSVDLGILIYPGIKVHCCFNLYKKPKELNKKLVYPKLVEIHREDNKGYNSVDYDFAIFRRGTHSGKLRTKRLHTQTYKIYVKDRSKVAEIKSKILSFDWLNYKFYCSAPYITKNDIHRLLNS